MARLPLIEQDEVPPEWAHAVQTYTELGEDAPDSYAAPISLDEDAEGDEDVQGDFPPLYGVLGHNPPLLDAMRSMLGALRTHAGLSNYHTELIILTIARELDNEYWWNRHVTVSVAGPVSLAEVRLIATDDLDGFEEPEYQILKYVRRYVTRSVTDEDHRELAAVLDDARIVGLTMFAGFYLGIVHVIDALDLSPADEFVGWQLENVA